MIKTTFLLASDRHFI